MKRVDLVVVASSTLPGLVSLRGPGCRPPGKSVQSLLTSAQFEVGERVSLVLTNELERLCPGDVREPASLEGSAGGEASGRNVSPDA